MDVDTDLSGRLAAAANISYAHAWPYPILTTS